MFCFYFFHTFAPIFHCKFYDAGYPSYVTVCGNCFVESQLMM